MSSPTGWFARMRLGLTEVTDLAKLLNDDLGAIGIANPRRLAGNFVLMEHRDGRAVYVMRHITEESARVDYQYLDRYYKRWIADGRSK